MRIPFAPWEPDRGEIDATVATVARNVLPAAGHYLPAPSLVALSGASALAGTPNGHFIAQASDGSFTMFASANDGSVDRIYYYSGGTWTDCSKTGGYSAADESSGWWFAQYGDYVWAVSGASNPVQRIDLAGLGTGFDDVAGNGGTDPPRAKYISVIAESIVLGGLTDYPTSVSWSGFGDSLEWRQFVNGSDIQTFPDGGLVTGLTASEYGIVYQENSRRRMVFSPGNPLMFEFQRISERSGTTACRALTSSNNVFYSLMEDGFYMDVGGNNRPIGKERVDSFFFNDLATDGLTKVIGYVDPVYQRVYWAYPSSSQSDLDLRDKLLCYNPQVDRWSIIETEVRWIGPVVQPGIGLDTEPLASSNIDTLAYSLDSRYWMGGRPVLGGFDANRFVGNFTGAALEAQIETGSVQASPPRRAMLRRASLLADTDSYTINVATRERPSQTDTWRTATAPSSSGYCHFTASGRFHKLRATIAEGATWTKAQGLEADAAPLGEY